MALSPDRTGVPVPALFLRCTLAYADPVDLLTGFGRNLSGNALFLPMHDPPDVGTLVRVEVVFGADRPALRGQGVVAWSTAQGRDADPQRQLAGCAIRLSHLDSTGRRLLADLATFKAQRREEFFDAADASLLRLPSGLAARGPTSTDSARRPSAASGRAPMPPASDSAVTPNVHAPTPSSPPAPDSAVTPNVHALTPTPRRQADSAVTPRVQDDPAASRTASATPLAGPRPPASPPREPPNKPSSQVRGHRPEAELEALLHPVRTAPAAGDDAMKKAQSLLNKRS